MSKLPCYCQDGRKCANCRHIEATLRARGAEVEPLAGPKPQVLQASTPPTPQAQAAEA